MTPLKGPTTEDHPSAHGLEFEYDCDAAKTRVSIRAVAPAPAPLITIFDQVVDAGFGKQFKFDEHGAVLELEKLDVSETPKLPEPVATTSTPVVVPAAKKRFSAFGFNKKRSLAADASGPALPVVDADAEANAARASVDEDGAGPAPKIQGGENGGAKVIIRLEALDEEGMHQSEHPNPTSLTDA